MPIVGVEKHPANADAVLKTSGMYCRSWSPGQCPDRVIRELEIETFKPGGRGFMGRLLKPVWLRCLVEGLIWRKHLLVFLPPLGRRQKILQGGCAFLVINMAKVLLVL